MIARHTSFASFLVVAAFAAALAGCGNSPPRPFPVTGEVLYRGKPLDDAQVTFIAAENQGPPARGTTSADGRFELTTYKPNDGAFAGEHQVTISKVTPVGGKVGEPYTLMKAVIPEKYSHSTQSPLKATVSAQGKNHFKFELTD